MSAFEVFVRITVTLLIPTVLSWLVVAATRGTPKETIMAEVSTILSALFLAAIIGCIWTIPA